MADHQGARSRGSAAGCRAAGAAQQGVGQQGVGQRSRVSGSGGWWRVHAVFEVLGSPGEAIR